MKSNIRKVLICAGMSLAIIIPTNVHAMENSSEANQQTYNKLFTKIENENIDVVYELNSLKSEYLNMLEKEDVKGNIEETNKIKSLIGGVESLKEDYISGMKTRANQPNTAVAAVIGYFSNKGYKLSSELLIHATLNTSRASHYTPTNGNVVKSHQVFQNIVKGNKTSGSAAFTNSGNTQSRDCYYALHKFNYKKGTPTSALVIITDYYDFASGDYNGMQGIAVDAMVNAQNTGAIVPYNITIKQTGTR